MGTKDNPGKFDCYAKATPEEPMFVLLGRDPQAAFLVSIWAKVRSGDPEAATFVFEEMLRALCPSYFAKPNPEKSEEATSCSIKMFEFLKEREAAKLRIAEIDTRFEKAQGWGSWMVGAANERESLANRFGFPHKHQARTAVGGRTN